MIALLQPDETIDLFTLAASGPVFFDALAASCS